MALALQWLLIIIGMFGGLMAKRICHRFGIPPFPWRAPWIALLAHTAEQSAETFRLPINAGLDSASSLASSRRCHQPMPGLAGSELLQTRIPSTQRFCAI